jgi:hypothetical protein
MFNTCFQVNDSHVIRSGAQHQEKKGAFFWNLWVKVVLKFLNFSVVPT